MCARQSDAVRLDLIGVGGRPSGLPVSHGLETEETEESGPDEVCEGDGGLGNLA